MNYNRKILSVRGYLQFCKVKTNLYQRLLVSTSTQRDGSCQTYLTFLLRLWTIWLV